MAHDPKESKDRRRDDRRVNTRSRTHMNVWSFDILRTADLFGEDASRGLPSGCACGQGKSKRLEVFATRLSLSL